MGWQWLEQGSGKPLVLLHGLGESSAVWDAVVGQLAALRRVIAFDLPGFGGTPALQGLASPTPADFAAQLPEVLREAGVGDKPDIVGHSMGGWIALEAARSGMVRSVVALAPSGLWRDEMPARTRVRLLSMWWMANYLPRLTNLTLHTVAGRTLTTFGLYGRPWAVPDAAATAAALDLANSPGFKPTFHGQAHERFRDGQGIQVPVTVAFGTRDTILGERTARIRDQLPASHHWIALPRCGHIPMWDDPNLVVQVILTATA